MMHFDATNRLNSEVKEVFLAAFEAMKDLDNFGKVIPCGRYYYRLARQSGHPYDMVYVNVGITKNFKLDNSVAWASVDFSTEYSTVFYWEGGREYPNSFLTDAPSRNNVPWITK